MGMFPLSLELIFKINMWMLLNKITCTIAKNIKIIQEDSDFRLMKPKTIIFTTSL